MNDAALLCEVRLLASLTCTTESIGVDGIPVHTSAAIPSRSVSVLLDAAKMSTPACALVESGGLASLVRSLRSTSTSLQCFIGIQSGLHRHLTEARH